MKTSKIPGLGRFGVFIDDVDFDNLSAEEWQEIGRLHLKTLVTIIRRTNLDVVKFQDRMLACGDRMALSEYRLNKKYGGRYDELYQKLQEPDNEISAEDAEHIRSIMNMMEVDDRGRLLGTLRVSGQRDAYGNPIGMFAEGELLWHSNESGNLVFTPGVSLLASKNVVGSATGFATTVDWYESQSESFRSELDDMIAVHRFIPGRINPGLRADQDQVMHRNMCPEDGTRIPLVRKSPGGYTGIHYPQNTIDHIEGMNQQESRRIFDMIEQDIFAETNVYDHWYQNENDLCIFDNSITQHRRLGDIKDRLCHRIQFDYSRLTEDVYQPYRQQPFKGDYLETYEDVLKVSGLVTVKSDRSMWQRLVDSIVRQPMIGA